MTEETKQLRNETPDEYRIRLQKNQNVYGLSNVEIGSLLNEAYGLDYDESAWRKKTRPYIQGYEDGIKSTESTKELLDEIKKERLKIQTLNIERNRIDRQTARHELFYEQIADKIDTVKDLKVPEIAIKENDSSEYVLTIADIHYGYVFSSVTGNEYSPEIATARMLRLAGLVSNYCKKNNIDKLTVLNLGDNIHGILRVSDLQANQSGIVSATIEVANLLGRFIEEIAKTVPQIDYYHVPESNHTQVRPLGTKASEIFTEDVEQIITEFLKVRFKGQKNIYIESCKAGSQYLFIPIYDYFVAACHGHNIKNPETANKDIAYTLGVDVDFLFMGHFHAQKEIPAGIGETYNSKFDRKTFMCPSIVGSDVYSDKILKSCCPSAEIFEFDRDHGHVGTRHFVL